MVLASCLGWRACSYAVVQCEYIAQENVNELQESWWKSNNAELSKNYHICPVWASIWKVDFLQVIYPKPLLSRTLFWSTHRVDLCSNRLAHKTFSGLLSQSTLNFSSHLWIAYENFWKPMVFYKDTWTTIKTKYIVERAHEEGPNEES